MITTSQAGPFVVVIVVVAVVIILLAIVVAVSGLKGIAVESRSMTAKEHLE